MQKIAYTMGSASDVAVMPLNADATIGITGSGESVFAGLVISRMGKPNTVLPISAANFKSVLGEPFRPMEGAHFEPMRHVSIAVKGGNGYVVRVPLPGMLIPIISVTGYTAPTLKVATSTAAFGTEITAVDKAPLTFYVDDGHKSTNRSLSFMPVTGKAGFFKLTLKSVDSMGTVTTLEDYEVSLNPDALSDMALSAYLPEVLESNESRIRCVLSSTTTELMKDYVGFKDKAFEGGSDGDVSKLTAASYDSAIAALENSLVEYTAILTLGIYDPGVIAKLATLAKDVRVDAFGDVNPRLTATQALEQMKSLGLGSNENITLYYFPYSCRDTLGQTTVVFGLSGDAFLAKSKGVALNSDVGGWHYSPAGSRGLLTRQNIKPLASAGSIRRKDFADAHLNVVASSRNGVMIDDALTACTENNYKKYQHVVSVTNAIARNFYALGLELKHQPDGITRDGWEKGLPRLLDRYVAAEALVKPSDTSQGDAPYVVEVTKLDFDYWKISYSISVTGVGRRMLGEPILFR